MSQANCEMSFEAAINRLEEIVRILEKSDISLEESMALYKEGAQCSRLCKLKLEQAKNELQIWQDEAPECEAEQ